MEKVSLHKSVPAAISVQPALCSLSGEQVFPVIAVLRIILCIMLIDRTQSQVPVVMAKSAPASIEVGRQRDRDEISDDIDTFQKLCNMRWKMYFGIDFWDTEIL